MSENALSTLVNAGLESPASNANLQALKTSSFIPSFAIGYPTTKAVKEGIARPGEFILGGQTSLGKTTEVVVLAWRMHAAWLSKQGAVETESFHFPVNGDAKDNAEYQAFLASPAPTVASKEMVEGADLLLWIPAQTMFGLFFMKKTLAKQAAMFVDAGKGGRLLTVGSVFKTFTNKKSGETFEWYECSVTPQQVAVRGSALPGVEATLDISGDMLSKFFPIWQSPAKGIKTEDENVERDR